MKVYVLKLKVYFLNRKVYPHAHTHNPTYKMYGSSLILLPDVCELPKRQRKRKTPVVTPPPPPPEPTSRIVGEHRVYQETV